MSRLGSSRIAYQPGAVKWRPNHVTLLPCACAPTMPLVDIVPAVRNTATIDRPIATSYEITCAADRRPPSSGYVDPEAYPARTMPYTPIAEHARTTSTATGTSVSCNG